MLCGEKSEKTGARGVIDGIIKVFQTFRPRTEDLFIASFSGHRGAGDGFFPGGFVMAYNFDYPQLDAIIVERSQRYHRDADAQHAYAAGFRRMADAIRAAVNALPFSNDEAWEHALDAWLAEALAQKERAATLREYDEAVGAVDAVHWFAQYGPEESA